VDERKLPMEQSMEMKSDGERSDHRLSQIAVENCSGIVFFLQKQKWTITIYISLIQGGMRIESANISRHWRCDGRSTCVL
jgi:hypothetical protein